MSVWSGDDSKPRVTGHAIGCPCGVGVYSRLLADDY